MALCGVSGLRERLRARDLLSATWVKTPHPHVVEVLALSELDALVLDAEHAPFDRAALDACLLAARAGGKPVLVRPESASPAAILQALDGGADGVVVPHIRSARGGGGGRAGEPLQPGWPWLCRQHAGGGLHHAAA